MPMLMDEYDFVDCVVREDVFTSLLEVGQITMCDSDKDRSV
jgi:hypothetical protein